MIVSFFADKCLFMFTGEKKKTKAIDNELNPVWNEVSGVLKLAVKCKSHSMWICLLGND